MSRTCFYGKVSQILNCKGSCQSAKMIVLTEKKTKQKKIGISWKDVVCRLQILKATIKLFLYLLHYALQHHKNSSKQSFIVQNKMNSYFMVLSIIYIKIQAMSVRPSVLFFTPFPWTNLRAKWWRYSDHFKVSRWEFFKKVLVIIFWKVSFQT